MLHDYEFIILQFDEQLVSHLQGWKSILTILQSQTQHKNKKFLLVIPPLFKSEETVTTLLNQISQHSQNPQQENIYKIIEGITLSWKNQFDHLAFELQLQQTEFISESFKKIENILLAISLLKSSSVLLLPKIIAQLLAFSGEIILQIAYHYLKQNIGNEFVQPLDVKMFLESESPDIQTSQHTSVDHVYSTNQWKKLQIETELEARLAEQYLRSVCESSPFVDQNLLTYLEEHIFQISRKCNLVLVQGNVAKDTNTSDVTIFGARGSDATASYMAIKLGASQVHYYTDSPGLFTSSIPNQTPFITSRILKQIHYDEAQEISATNSTVLNPYSIYLLREANIPLLIHSQVSHCITKAKQTNQKSLEDILEETSTLIGELIDSPRQPQIKCACLRTGVTLISINSVSMWRRSGFLADVFNVFAKHKLSIDFVTTSETNVTCTMDTSKSLEQNILQAVRNELKVVLGPNCDIFIKSQCAAISLVGNQIRRCMAELSPIFKLVSSTNSSSGSNNLLEEEEEEGEFSSGEFEVHMISHAASDVNLTFVLDEKDAMRLLQKIHTTLFEKKILNSSVVMFGNTWHVLQH